MRLSVNWRYILTRSPAVSRLEDRLADYVGRAHCVCVGSGTLALTLALQSMDFPHGSEVIVPSICCDAVPYAVAYAGLKPVFCDVAVADYNMSVTSVADVVSPQTRAVIPAHMFGYPVGMDDLLRYARDNSVAVIEDAAQAFGGSYHGAKLCGFGELSVTSFGRGKILDVGLGGAVFTDDPALADDVRRIAAHSRTYAASAAHIARVAYSRLERWRTGDSASSRLRRRIAPYVFRVFSFRPVTDAWAAEAWTALDGIDDVLTIRKRNAALYRELITTDAVTHPHYADGDGACFRYSILAQADRRPRIETELAKRGEWASRLYPPLHKVYGPSTPSARPLECADFVGPRILNLVVAPSYGQERILKVAHLINEIA